MSNNSSVTWSIHVRLLCLLYGLPDPLHLLEKESIWPKEKWKNLTKTMVTIYHENDLRTKAKANSKMHFLNVQALGLTGRTHPALYNIEKPLMLTSQDSTLNFLLVISSLGSCWQHNREEILNASCVKVTVKQQTIS